MFYPLEAAGSSRSCGCRGSGWLSDDWLCAPAQALPSFARQTGQPCGTCHTDYPALTPFGRRFKLLGYTTGGGQFRTTPFSSNDARNVQAEYNKLRGYAETVKVPPQPLVDANSRDWVPPISMMAIVGFTHTQADHAVAARTLSIPTTTSCYSPFSVFWGGAITSNIGAFAQVTYNAPGPVARPPGNHQSVPAHLDLGQHRCALREHRQYRPARYRSTASPPTTIRPFRISGTRRPAWSIPLCGIDACADARAPATMIEGAFAAHVGGVGAYTMINDMLYLEVTGYKTLRFSAAECPGHRSVWSARPARRRRALLARGARAALGSAHAYDRHLRHVSPRSIRGSISRLRLGTTGTIPLADKFTDIGFDSQYQYQGDNFWVTLRANYIREFQRLDASFATMAVVQSDQSAQQPEADRLRSPSAPTTASC